MEVIISPMDRVVGFEENCKIVKNSVELEQAAQNRDVSVHLKKIRKSFWRENNLIALNCTQLVVSGAKEGSNFNGVGIRLQQQLTNLKLRNFDVTNFFRIFGLQNSSNVESICIMSTSHTKPVMNNMIPFLHFNPTALHFCGLHLDASDENLSWSKLTVIILQDCIVEMSFLASVCVKHNVQLKVINNTSIKVK